MAVNRTIGIVPNVLAKDEITNWWWFNESLGREASDSVGDNHGDLLGGMKWAADSMEGTSVQFEKPGQLMDMGTVASTFNAGRFSFPFGLSVKGGFFVVNRTVSNVMLSLGDENGSTLQIGTKSNGVDIFMASAVRSQRVSLGSE